MKKLGIIGGAGPLASALLYESIIQESYRSKSILPEIFLLNYPFTRGLSEEESLKNGAKLQDELQLCIDKLKKHEVDFFIIACNTLHRYLHLLDLGHLSCFSLPSLILDEALKRGHQSLLILGTKSTKASKLYYHRYIEIVYPTFEDQTALDLAVDNILKGDILLKDSLAIQKIITASPVDAVVLGCSDLPVLHHIFPILSDKPILDSIKLTAKILNEVL